MSNSDVILEYLEENQPEGYCDDCLSSLLDITPRQQVNQIANRLFAANTIGRSTGICATCQKRKIVNKFGSDLSSAYRTPIRRGGITIPKINISNVDQIDIDKIRNEIVKICHEIWKDKKSGDPPRGLSFLINSLKEENLLPRHQANMMLTLCNLRNVKVYDQVEIGPKEKLVALAAWDIVSDWWKDQN